MNAICIRISFFSAPPSLSSYLSAAGIQTRNELWWSQDELHFVFRVASLMRANLNITHLHARWCVDTTWSVHHRVSNGVFTIRYIRIVLANAHHCVRRSVCWPTKLFTIYPNLFVGWVTMPVQPQPPSSPPPIHKCMRRRRFEEIKSREREKKHLINLLNLFKI